MIKNETTILGVRIDDVTLAETLERICDAVEDGEPCYAVTPNPAILLRASDDQSLRRALNESTMSVPDGVGVLFASALMRQRLRERVTGVDLSVEIAREAAERGWKVGLWSPDTSIADRAGTVLKSAFLGFEPIMIEKGVIPDHVDVLLVGLGAPHQEKWMNLYCGRVSATVMVGVGGSLDLIAGVRPRAPRFLRVIGFEWLWRLLIEPRRHWSRIVQSLVSFPLAVLRHKKEAPQER